MMRWLDHFTVVLLDMNGTFMFGHDRLGPTEDYFASYLGLGGGSLTRGQVQQALQATCDALLRHYADPTRFEDFPALDEALREYAGVPECEIERLRQVFARHEMGSVPEAHAAFIARLSRTHQLGIVSNLCATPEPWREQFRSSGLLQSFKTTVFSSEGRTIKPALSLFERALSAFPSDARVLFVGDSLDRDIVPAKSLGLATAWLAPAGSAHAAADRTLPSLLELEDLRDGPAPTWPARAP